MEESRGKYLIKNTAIFAIGNMASKAISFFLVPLYTNVLSTTQYGLVDLINTLCMVLAPILIMNINESVMRFSLDKNANYSKILSTGVTMLLLELIFALPVIPLSSIFRSINGYGWYIYFFTITNSGSQLFLCYLRGKERLIQYSIGNVIQTFAIAVFNIFFLLVLKLGVKGYLLAYISSSFITMVFAIIAGSVIDDLRHFEIDRELSINMLKYSIVLIPNTFMWWVMNSSDRVMIISMVGIAANGIYAISYKLPTLVNTVMQVFNQAWSYSAIREKGAQDEIEYNNKTFIQLISLTMIAGIGIICFAKPFLRVYVGSEYFAAWKYIPFLTIGCVYLTLGTFMATSYTVHKDSFGYLFSGMVGAVVNISLNLILIPLFEVYGAAIATCASYIAVFLFRLIHTRKYINYNIRNLSFWFGTLMLSISSVLIFVESIIQQLLLTTLFIVTLTYYSRQWIPLLKKTLLAIQRRQ